MVLLVPNSDATEWGDRGTARENIEGSDPADTVREMEIYGPVTRENRNENGG